MLAHILVSGFDPFQGVPEESAREHGIDAWTSSSRTSHNRKVPALEIAIITESKTFLSSSACQRVVNAIFEGQVVYTPTTFIDILPDHYKRKPISLYNPRSAPLLNQYRLCVPRTRNILEICHFIVLLTLFLFIMAERDPSVVSIREIVFIIYTLGWVLDQTGSILEHGKHLLIHCERDSNRSLGWHVYTQNLWSFLDVTFSVIFGIYLVLRIHGWRAGNLAQGQQALDVLAMGAPVLVPRLAFNLMSENMLFISLREMMRDFTVLTMLAVWCFAGFLLSMTWLSNGAHRPITISKWMLWVWFGLDGTGIQRSVEFHPILGPMLMVGFALLGNTLFLTILVSMLSTTFSTIVANATAEIHFRRAVLTLEGVKSDALFAYQPPLNILALLTLLPLKMMISPRWFHKINVAAVRTLNAPLLLLIGLIERRTLWAHTRRPSDVEQLPKSTSRLRFWNFSHGLTAHGDIEAVFDTEPPQEIEELIENEDDSGGRNGLQREFGTAVDASQQGMQNGGGDGRGRKEREDAKGKVRPRRRDSMYPFGEPTDRMRPTDSGSDEEEDEDMRERLQALEESTRRIEKMLETLCIGLAEPPSNRSGSNLAGETGTWRDLDRSASTAIED